MKIYSLSGFLYPFKGLKFIFRHPSLISLIAIPVVINTILYAIFIWYTSSRMGGWINYLIPSGNEWYLNILYYVLLVVVSVFMLIVIFYTFALIGILILSPFNEIISERVEALYTGNKDVNSFELKAFLRDMIRSYKAELGRLLIYLSGFLLLLLLNLVPVAGTLVYGVLVTIYTLFFLCWEFYDYPMERWRFDFALKRKAAFKNILLFVSFGAGASIFLIIPFLNLMAIPVCVIGATLLFCDMLKTDRLPENLEKKEL